MSTFGKVLVVLVMLALLGWIFLASLVADYNANGSKRNVELKAERDALKADLPPLVEQVRNNTDEASLYQVELDRLRRNYRAELAMAQKVESDTKEALSRYTLQLATAQKEVASAQARHEVRRQERVQFDADIAQAEAGVRDLQARNEALRKELADLQQSFLTTVAENKSYAERLAKPSPGANARPRARLGSLAR